MSKPYKLEVSVSVDQHGKVERVMVMSSRHKMAVDDLMEPRVFQELVDQHRAAYEQVKQGK